MKSLRPITRFLLASAVLAMVSGYFLPMWEIQLWAPQYPEGLNMKIWLNHLSGDFDIINGLNHYIGMKHIKQEMFPEFGYMGYVLGLLIFLGLLPVVIGKRILLQVFVAVLFLCAGLGLYDFWSWGYDYGHQLDPKAAISVPGMSYQPPIIGYKSLLNFVAYSGPDKGGWVLVGSGAVATVLLIFEIVAARRKAKLRRWTGLILPLVAMVLVLPGCKKEPEAIGYGKDECTGCKMILADKHYGSEFITDKGKIFKFDDLNCLQGFLREQKNPKGRIVVIDFNHPNRFLNADEALFLKHAKLRTPMGSGVASFEGSDAARAVDRELGGGGQFFQWEEITRDQKETCTCAH